MRLIAMLTVSAALILGGPVGLETSRAAAEPVPEHGAASLAASEPLEAVGRLERATEVLQAQAPPPGQPNPVPPQQAPDQGYPQHIGIGLAGLLLIATVLILRKWRKKPVLPLYWNRGS